MDILPGADDRFLDIFNQVKHKIRAHKGCLHLEILRGHDQGLTSLWTISVWQSADDLETYRTSALFRQTWSEVKPLFSAPASAWTLASIETIA